MKTLAAFLLLLLLMTVMPNGILAQGQPISSLFSDRRARQVGDVLTILIVEYSSAKSQASSSTNKSSEHGFLTNGGKASNAYMPLFGLKGQLKNGFNNDAETTRKGSLTGKITAMISKVNPNGSLVISGVREVVVNGETERITVSGIVRPEDVRSDNTVYSYNIAQAKISYQGKGLVGKGQSPGLIDKILGWIF